jgi:small subunit ribosomal protein S1
LTEQEEENYTPGDAISEHQGNGEPEHPMDALLKEGYGLEAPKQGEIRVGTIANITDTNILVDVGAKSEGVISVQELERLSEDRRAEIRVGKEVTVYVLRTHGTDGIIDLSLLRAEEEEDWRTAEGYLDSQEPYEGVISGYNKGGLIIKLGHLRGFLPASQVSFSRRRRAKGESPEERWGDMLDEPILAKVIEVDRSRNRLILSERAAAREARDVLKERLIDELEVGEVRSGHVISLADFGAFVDIGGADGLVHSSEISWKRVSHPSEVLKVGQKVQVKVLSLDRKRKRISLSLRELEADPWEDIVAKFQEGQLILGRITKLTKFGAFASLVDAGEYEIEGLIHISELSDRRIEHPREIVAEGQEVTLRIVNIDRERRRIGLSLKKVDSTEYAELDWKVAMQEIQEVEGSEAGQEQVGQLASDAEEGPADASATAEVPSEAEEMGEREQEPIGVNAAGEGVEVESGPIQPQAGGEASEAGEAPADGETEAGGTKDSEPGDGNTPGSQD